MIEKINKKKQQMEIFMTISSVLATLCFVAAMILIQYQVYVWLAILFGSSLFFVILIIAYAIKHSQIKTTYQSLLKKSLDQLTCVQNYQNKLLHDEVKTFSKKMKAMSVIPHFTYLITEHIMTVNYQNYDFVTYDLYASRQAGKSSVIVFLGSVYAFDIEHGYEHLILTNNRKLKPKKINKIQAHDPKYGIYSTHQNVDSHLKSKTLLKQLDHPMFHSITVVLKDNQIIIAVEKKRRRFEFSAFKKLESVKVYEIENKITSEFDEVIKILDSIER